MKNTRWLSAVVVIAVALAGPLAPVAALAQAPPPPGPASAPPMQSMQPETTAVAPPPPSQGAKVGAGVLNVVYVPGKAILCGIGTVVAGGLMLLTFGSAYRPATEWFKEGCDGPWVLTPEMVSNVPAGTPLEN